jgi:hypothetical protein
MTQGVALRPWLERRTPIEPHRREGAAPTVSV